MNVNLDAVIKWGVVGAVVFGGYSVFKAKQVVETKLNPASDQNIIYDNLLGANDSAATQSTLDKTIAYSILYNPFSSEAKKQQARDLLRTFYGEDLNTKLNDTSRLY